MEQPKREELDAYYREAASWSEDRIAGLNGSRRTAWIIAGVAAAIAVLEAIAIVLLVPLKTVVPYTLLVDKQTGYVEALKPLDQQTVAPDTALLRSFLVQYVIAREGFDIDQVRDNYRKVGLWSAEDARNSYLAAMQPNNPSGPLASLPRRALVEVQVRGVSALGSDTSLVRFATIRTDPGGQPQAPQLWAAVVKYRFTNANMSVADRMTNPLGFQVTRYHRDAETAPVDVTIPSAPPAIAPPAAAVGPAPAVPTVPMGQ